MSLANLIKNMHRTAGRPSLQPLIEQHFMKKSVEFDEERHLDRMTRFHPSQVTYWGVCVRAYYLAMKREALGLEVQIPTPFETKLLRVFEHGHSVHSMYQDKILAEMGILYGKWELNGTQVEGFQPAPDWKYVEPRMWWAEKRMSGYCDGYLHIDGRWYVLEIKSSNDQGFRYLKRSPEPRAYHAKQAQLYIHAPNDLEKKFDIDGAIILYVNKDTGEEVDFFVPNDKTMIQPILDDIDLAIASLEQDIIPNRVEDCKSINSKRAKDCKVCNACFMV